jgi:hypothetical protein
MWSIVLEAISYEDAEVDQVAKYINPKFWREEVNG